MLVVLALLTYPTLHSIISAVDLTGQLPLTAAAVTLLSYAFLGLIVYAIIRLKK
jgi:hypothetical protein